MRAFVQRDFKRAETQIALIFAGALLPLAVSKALWASALPETSLFVAVLLFTLLSLLLALRASWLLQRSPAIFRWLPTGEARPGDRIRNAAMKSIRHSAAPREQMGKSKFAIRFSAGDQYVARIVERVFARAGWTKATEQETADRELVLVSAETNLDLAQAFSGYRSRPPPIVVITSNGVQEGVLGSLARHQWVDFRRRRRSDLRRAARHLSGGADVTRSVELNEVPEHLRNPVLPGYLRIVLRLLYLSIAIFSLVAVLLVWNHAFLAFLDVFTPTQAREFRGEARSAFDAAEGALMSAYPDLQTRLGLEFLNVMLFSPIRASLIALVIAALVTGLAWLANAVVGRRISRTATLRVACVLSLGLLNVFFEVVPFSDLLGLLGIVLVIGELRCAWSPAPERPFRERAMDALTDLAGWRETRKAIVLIFALLWGGMMLILSFA